MPRIWDTLIFGTESDLDLLECRLTELDDHAWRFVIAEAGIDHQGHAKPFWLKDNWERFSPWHDRIVWVDATESMQAVPPPPERGTYWPLETAHRDALRVALNGVEPDDLVLHGDVDEIPKGELLAAGTVTGCQHHVYCIEWLCIGWTGTVCLRAADAPASPRAMRNLMGSLPRVNEGGWHLSWFGGLDANVRKLDTTVHADIPDHVRRDVCSGRYQRGGWHWMGMGGVASKGSVMKLKPYKGDDLPKWVLAGKEPASWHRDALRGLATSLA